MATIQLLKRLFRPRAHGSTLPRSLRQHIRKQGVLRIVEIGVGDVSRAMAMISVAQSRADGGTVDYTGIDMFDARGAHEPELSLKEAHRQLVTTGAAIRLIPGDPHTALSQYANRLPSRDLIVVTADLFTASLEQSWFYLPRMLHDEATVWLESRSTGPHDESSFERFSAHQVVSRVHARRRRAA